MATYTYGSPWTGPTFERFDRMDDVLEKAVHMLISGMGPRVNIYKASKSKSDLIGTVQKGYIMPVGGKYAERRNVLIYESIRNKKFVASILHVDGTRTAIPKGWNASW